MRKLFLIEENFYKTEREVSSQTSWLISIELSAGDFNNVLMIKNIAGIITATNTTENSCLKYEINPPKLNTIKRNIESNLYIIFPFFNSILLNHY